MALVLHLDGSLPADLDREGHGPVVLAALQLGLLEDRLGLGGHRSHPAIEVDPAIPTIVVDESSVRSCSVVTAWGRDHDPVDVHGFRSVSIHPGSRTMTGQLRGSIMPLKPRPGEQYTIRRKFFTFLGASFHI